MPAGEQVVGDRALQGCLACQVFYAGVRSSEDEQLDRLVVGLRLVRRMKASLESQDVALGRQVVGELRVEQPRVQVAISYFFSGKYRVKKLFACVSDWSQAVVVRGP